MNGRVLLALVLGFGLQINDLKAQIGAGASEPSVFGVFCGSTPCGEPIRQVLQIPADAEAELIEWQVTLYQDANTRTPSRYELRCEYGLTVPNRPGLGKGIKKLDRQGTWTIARGTKSNPEAVVYELNGAASLYQLAGNILHVLNADRSLMIGTGGWSYTLNRVGHSEKPADPGLVLSQPDMSYQISPLATGPTLFGVFEGRTPCQGIARESKIPVDAACMKVKWRVTLYQNPETRAPTTYKIESSLHRRAAREGAWTIMRGTEKDPTATVYRLAPTKTEPVLFLLKGDDNVLFFLDQEQNRLTGNCEFSYTLNRRSAP